jgi:hypothetical protein
LALVVLSVVEQRLDVVRAVLAGASVVETAARPGCPGRRRIAGSVVICRGMSQV